MRILLTGGAGYIGSHIAVELLNTGYTPIIVDSFECSSLSVIENICKITGRRVDYYECDIRDIDVLSDIFVQNDVDAVIHLAGYKSIEESIRNPDKYFSNNIGGTIALLSVMKEFNVNKIVFSSSASVYPKSSIPLTENILPAPISPYGNTKVCAEKMLKEAANCSPQFKAISLRYFNPVGADKSGLLGEPRNNMPSNLLPAITHAAANKDSSITVFGDDFDTPDGTCIRDYIHVTDLAIGHIKALEHLEKFSGYDVFNLGTGRGISVFEMIAGFEEAVGISVNYSIGSRRPGDRPICVSDPTKAETILGWKSKKSLPDMCKDAWKRECTLGSE